RRTARWCIVMLVICAGGDALYVDLGLSPWVRGRAYIGAGLDPNESAAFFVCVLPLAIMLASERGLTRWVGLAAAPLFVTGIAKTASRGGLIGLIVVAVVTMIQTLAKRRWVQAIAIVICAATFMLNASDTLVDRFQ